MVEPRDERPGVDPILFAVIALIAIVAIAVLVVLLLRGTDGTTSATDTLTATTGAASPPSSADGAITTSEDIEDGRHFGYFASVTIGDSTATGEFDLAQFFTGDAAVQAAAEDGIADYELDYYIRNVNARLRTLVFDPHADVTLIDPDDCCDPVDSNVADFAVEIRPEDGCWVTIASGIVTRVEQQYLP